MIPNNILIFLLQYIEIHRAELLGKAFLRNSYINPQHTHLLDRHLLWAQSPEARDMLQLLVEATLFTPPQPPHIHAGIELTG